jgi:hypothetical protein
LENIEETEQRLTQGKISLQSLRRATNTSAYISKEENGYPLDEVDREELAVGLEKVSKKSPNDCNY